jgi:hypothetical protein
LEQQKKAEQMNMVTMMASYGARLCPEWAAAAIVKRIGKPPG